MKWTVHILSTLTEVLVDHTVALENMLNALTFTDDTPSSSVHLFQSLFYCGKVTGDSPVVYFKDQFVLWSLCDCLVQTFLQYIF